MALVAVGDCVRSQLEFLLKLDIQTTIKLTIFCLTYFYGAKWNTCVVIFYTTGVRCNLSTSLLQPHARLVLLSFYEHLVSGYSHGIIKIYSRG